MALIAAGEETKMPTTEIQGGCLCGAVRYRATGAPLQQCMCHCEDCRRACGAQSVAWITVPLDGFTWTQGEAAQFHSSPGVTRTFCGRCGTSLTYQHERRAQEVDITTGSLDDPEAFPPTRAVFAEQKLSWA
jgi:hypothetical protein